MAKPIPTSTHWCNFNVETRNGRVVAIIRCSSTWLRAYPSWRPISPYGVKSSRAPAADCWSPRDPEAIASAIGWLFTHPDEGAAMGERGRQSVGTTYNWGVEAKKLLAFYERLLA